MIEQRDEELSRIYRDAEGPRPPQRVDDNVLAASQRVAGLVRRPAGIGFARRWGVPVALAATVLVTSTLALMVYERQSGLDAIAPQAPRAGRPAKVSPAEPVRADQPARPPPAVLPPIAPAPPISQALQSERVEQRPGTGQFAFTPEVPRMAEVLPKREEPKPASAAPAPAANVRAGAIPPQPPVPEAQRAFDLQPPIRPVQAPAATPAPSSNVVRESASTLQGSSVGAGIVSRLAVPEAKERTPEKWLDDIRKLRLEGKMAEADRELAEFKKRYPDYRLPEDLP